MADVTVQKRGKVYRYKFEIASFDGKRKYRYIQIIKFV